MFNKKVIYLSALFLCTQDTTGMNMGRDTMDVDSGTAPKGRLLSDIDERVNPETLTNTTLCWGEVNNIKGDIPDNIKENIESLVNYYSANMRGHPENVVKCLIWKHVADFFDIDICAPLVLSEEAHILISSMVRGTQSEQSEEIINIRKLLVKIISMKLCNADRLISDLNTPRKTDPGLFLQVLKNHELVEGVLRRI